MGNKKLRLDVLLYERGLFPSREAARRAVMAGLVKDGDDVLDKPGQQVREDIQVSVAKPLHPYVGRGGLKLEKALSVFSLRLEGRIVVDVGASTGGFTDCALQHGASHVYAVDVGYGQLAWKLRADERVTVLERTNFRHIDTTVFNPKPSVAVMDVSFISAGLLFPKLLEVLSPPFDIISLVKPQFEAGRDDVGKGGIVRDVSVHKRVLQEHVTMGQALGLQLCGLTHSPVTGGDGNIEYLAWWQDRPALADTTKTIPNENSLPQDIEISEVVATAWNSLTQQGKTTTETE